MADSVWLRLFVIRYVTCNTAAQASFGHYENTPVQIYWKFYHQKMKTFRWKILVVFVFLLKNIDCGYSLEPPWQGGSNGYPQFMF